MHVQMLCTQACRDICADKNYTGIKSAFYKNYLMFVCAGMEARGLHWKTSIYCVQTTSAVVLHLVFSDKILHWTQDLILTNWLNSKLGWAACFCPPFRGLHVNVTICGFYAGAGDQNSSLHMHMTGVYQWSPPSRPSTECLFKRKKITSLKMKVPCRREGSGVKSTRCSFRGAGVSSQYPHGSSQLSAPPVSEGSNARFWHLQAPGIHMVHKHTERQKKLHRK